MKKPLALAAAALALAACHPRQGPDDWKKALSAAGAPAATALPAPQPDDTRRFVLGRILVVERTDAHSPLSYIAATNVIAADAGKRDEIQHVAEALFPKVMGGPTGPQTGRLMIMQSLGAPRVQTVDDYIQGMRDSEARRTKAGGPALPPLDYDQLRADLDKDLAGHDAVVLRYLHERKD